MWGKMRWLLAAILAAGVVLAGCGSGGGGGKDENGAGPPSVTGYHYVLTIVNETVEEIEITRGTTSTDWIAVSRQSGESVWGTYTVLASGIVKMVRTGYTHPGFVSPPVLYAVEIPQGYLFLFDPEHGTPGGGYLEMDVAANQEGTCAAITTQGDYNLVKTGQEEFDQTLDPAFGTAMFAAGETGMDLNGSVYTVTMNLMEEPIYGLNVSGMGCAAGMGGSVDDHFAFTATGIGVYTHSDGTKDQDFVVLPEPASPVDEAALMAAGKRYVGFWQGMEYVDDVLTEVIYLVKADGQDTGIEADSFVNPDTGELSGMPGTLVLARASGSEARGLFDNAIFTFGVDYPARAAAYTAGGKYVIVTIGQFDSNSDEDVSDPQDWFFLVLMEQ